MNTNNYFSLMLVLVVLTVAGCGSEPKEEPAPEPQKTVSVDDAVIYFNKVLVPYRKYSREQDTNSRQIRILMHSSDPKAFRALLNVIRTDLPEERRRLQEAREATAAIPDFNGDSSLQSEVLGYIKYLYEYADFQLPQLLPILERVTDPEIPISDQEYDHLDMTLERLGEEWDQRGERFEKAQDMFAEKYGFKLRPEFRPERIY